MGVSLEEWRGQWNTRDMKLEGYTSCGCVGWGGSIGRLGRAVNGGEEAHPKCVRKRHKVPSCLDTNLKNKITSNLQQVILKLENIDNSMRFL